MRRKWANRKVPMEIRAKHLPNVTYAPEVKVKSEGWVIQPSDKTATSECLGRRKAGDELLAATNRKQCLHGRVKADLDGRSDPTR